MAKQWNRKPNMGFCASGDDLRKKSGLPPGSEAVPLAQRPMNIHPKPKCWKTWWRFCQERSIYKTSACLRIRWTKTWPWRKPGDRADGRITVGQPHLAGSELGRSTRDCRGVGASQPALSRKELKLLHDKAVIQEDGDLTGMPVSNTSRTYPNAAYGHMDDEIRLGYQAGVTSIQSPTYGRLWLSVEHHAGDTVSCTQAEALILAAEQRTGLRPRRRTELLKIRIAACQQARQPTEKR